MVPVTTWVGQSRYVVRAMRRLAAPFACIQHQKLNSTHGRPWRDARHPAQYLKRSLRAGRRSLQKSKQVLLGLGCIHPSSRKTTCSDHLGCRLGSTFSLELICHRIWVPEFITLIVESLRIGGSARVGFPPAPFSCVANPRRHLMRLRAASHNQQLKRRVFPGWSNQEHCVRRCFH